MVDVKMNGEVFLISHGDTEIRRDKDAKTRRICRVGLLFYFHILRVLRVFVRYY